MRHLLAANDANEQNRCETGASLRRHVSFNDFKFSFRCKSFRYLNRVWNLAAYGITVLTKSVFYYIVFGMYPKILQI